MKVGTDGVLLGAWARIPTSAQTILDVGTGCGLIALMLAQRTTHASIFGVDVCERAISDARVNAQKSPFYLRVFSVRKSIQQGTLEFEKRGLRFEAIVCNPPFFSDSLLSPKQQRTIARHQESLSLPELFDYSKRLIANDGILSLILPVEQFEPCMRAATSAGFNLSRKTLVRPLPDRPCHRMLLEFLHDKPCKTIEEELLLETEHHCRSPEFQTLTSNFYLN
ncbi:MAG: methyltransferase [Pirellulaceae bacterium]